MLKNLRKGIKEINKWTCPQSLYLVLQVLSKGEESNEISPTKSINPVISRPSSSEFTDLKDQLCQFTRLETLLASVDALPASSKANLGLSPVKVGVSHSPLKHGVLYYSIHSSNLLYSFLVQQVHLTWGLLLQVSCLLRCLLQHTPQPVPLVIPQPVPPSSMAFSSTQFILLTYLYSSLVQPVCLTWDLVL